MKVSAFILGAALIGCSENGGEAGDPNPNPGALAELTPMAPPAGKFGWQSLYTAFKDRRGTPCTGAVTVAIGDQVTCYVAADDSLRCAGVVGSKNFGNQFVDTGQTGVDQILISPTFYSEIGNQLCIHKTDGTVLCVGYGNVINADDFTQWGSMNNLVAIGTGTFSQLCGIDTAGQIYCSGIGISSIPSIQDGGRTHTWFWMDGYGKINTDDAVVLRASANRTVCQVTANGLTCGDATYVAPGSVVDAMELESATFFPAEHICWLSSDGKVACYKKPRRGEPIPSMQQFFTSGSVLALASDYYTSSLCAVYSDGSLACRGHNAQGQLGTGDNNPLADEKIVQPPGSVRINCH